MALCPKLLKVEGRFLERRHFLCFFLIQFLFFPLFIIGVSISSKEYCTASYSQILFSLILFRNPSNQNKIHIHTYMNFILMRLPSYYTSIVQMTFSLFSSFLKQLIHRHYRLKASLCDSCKTDCSAFNPSFSRSTPNH